MYWYIKKNNKNKIVELSDELSTELYNNIGSTLDDYYKNMWVRLNDDQVSFYKENTSARIEEIWNCKLELPVHIRTIDEAKKDAINRINIYDSSRAVNNFIVNGKDAWFTANERNNYKQSIDAAKLLNIDTLSFFIGDTLYSISTDVAEQLLAQIQLYADQCFLITKQHKLNIENIYNSLAEDTISKLDNYDNTINYPKLLEFKL